MNQRSVIRAIDILTLISETPGGLSLNEIVSVLDIPKTSCYEILLMLQEKSMVQVEEARVKRYQLGVQSFVIGSRFIQNFDLVNTAAPIADACSADLGMTVFLAVRDGQEIIYLYKSEPRDVLIHTESVGNRAELFCTSLGKALLSFLPEPEQETLLEAMVFRKRTERTHGDRESLKRDLDQCRLRGYALDDREVLDLVLCVGVPVFDHRGYPLAGLSAAGLYSETRDPLQEARILQEAALRLSRQLGYSGPAFPGVLQKDSVLGR